MHEPAVRRLPPSALRRSALWVAPLFACTLASPAQAQDLGGLRLSSALDLSVTRTDNSNVLGAGPTQDTVTTWRPSLTVLKPAGTLRGNLDYGLLLTRREAEVATVPRDQVTHNLNARATYDLLPQVVQFTGYALAARQTVSAYGLQTVDTATYNPNQSQTFRAGLSPTVRGMLGEVARYELTLNADGYHARGVASPNALQTGATLQLTSQGERRLIGWTAYATQQRSRYSGGVPTDNGRAYVSAVLRPDVDLSVGVRGGAETVKVGEAYDRRYTNWGGDLTWAPTARSRATLTFDERYYGRSHALQLDHRFASSSVRFSSVQGLGNNTAGAGTVGTGATQTLLQAYMNLQQFVVAQPDAEQREVLVRAFLKALGLDPNSVVGGGLLNAGSTLQRRDEVGWTYSAARVNVSLQAFRTDSRRVDSEGVAVDGSRVLQKGASLTAAYKFTPTSALSVGHTRVKTAPSPTLDGNELQSSTLAVSERIGRYASVSLNARRTVYQNTVNPYRESALGLALNVRF